MKRNIPLALAGALTIATSPGAVTDPVGYTTETLLAGQFNLVGLSVHESVLASGTLTGVAATSVTDTNADFTTSLVGANVFILEITSGASAGVIQEITAFTATELTTVVDLGAVGVQAGDTYEVRPAATIGTVFGADNEAGLLAGTATTADVVWVPDGSGGFSQYYRQAAQPPFVPTEQWAQVGQSGSAADAPIIYADAIFVQRRGATDLEVVIAGEVKLISTVVPLSGGGSFNYVGTGFPVGSTLDNSGLEAYVTAGSATTADVVWVPNGSGGYNQFYYQAANPPFVPEAQWAQIGQSGDAGAAELKAGIIIQRRAAGDTNAVIEVPPYNL